MKNLINNVNRHLTAEEHRALLDCEEILQKAFKSKVFTIFLNSERDVPDRCSGIKRLEREIRNGMRTRKVLP